jgi:hypothetical protein
VPTYRWSCFVCHAGNAPEATACESCGFPANANGAEIERAQLDYANRTGTKDSTVCAPNPKVGTAVLALALIQFAALPACLAVIFVAFVAPPLAVALAAVTHAMLPFLLSERIIGADPTQRALLVAHPVIATAAHWGFLAVVSAALVRYKWPQRPIISAALVAGGSALVSALMLGAFSVEMVRWKT